MNIQKTQNDEESIDEINISTKRKKCTQSRFSNYHPIDLKAIEKKEGMKDSELKQHVTIFEQGD